MIVINDIIEEIVLSLVNTNDVVSFTDNLDGTYTIETTGINDIEESFKVVLIYSDTTQNRDVIVSSISGNKFTFSGTNIPDPINWKLALYFEPGHRVELNKKYLNKAKSTNKKIQEYPLFWLYKDLEERPSDFDNVEFETTMQFALVDFTEKDLYEDQRIEQKFKTVLYPLLVKINDQFNKIPYKNHFVTMYGNKEIDFIKTDRPFFGSADQSKNVMPEPTDAIECQVDLLWREEGSVCSKY
jgi:hypothetical protein